MVSAGMTCVKYLLFCFNLLFAISGIAILTVGAVIQASYLHYSNFVDSNFVSVPIILIIVGAIIFVIAFFGCCGALRENSCMIITFSVFLLIIFSLEFAVCIAGYLKHDEVSVMLENKFNETLANYSKNKEIHQSWDVLQHDLECCGIHSPKDWRVVFPNGTLPNTCCRDTPRDTVCKADSKNIYGDSCLPRLRNILETNAYVIGAVGIVIALIQLIGVLCACCLARSIRREYETV